MTTYYFAARYSRHPEMRDYRDQLLHALPYRRVTSRWIDMHGDELEATIRAQPQLGAQRGDMGI